jgi:hypothetical protein
VSYRGRLRSIGLPSYGWMLAVETPSGDLQTEKPRPRGRGSFNISVQSVASTAGADSVCVGIDVAARAEVIELCGVRARLMVTLSGRAMRVDVRCQRSGCLDLIPCFPYRRRPHSSSVSRRTAGLSGFFNLSQ